MMIKRPVSRQPIPKHAKRVFEGKIFDVYQWRQELFDGKFAVFEKIKRVDTVNIFPITSDKNILLSKQTQPGGLPFIGAFGGRIDEGEDPLEAAKRELLEEAGIEADRWILWSAEQFFSKIDWAIYNFVAKDLKKVTDPKPDAGEKIETIAVSFEKFLKIVAQENYRDTEVSLRLFRIMSNPQELKKIKKMFMES